MERKYFERRRRGFSPIISVILMVGVAVFASALAFSWYTGVQKGSGETTGQVAAKTSQATGAALLIINVETNATAFNITLKNNGAVNATKLKTYVNNEPVGTSGATYVSPGEIDNLWNSSYSISGVASFKVISQEGGEAQYVVAR